MEADGRPQKQPTSPWLYVGCGCGAAVILAMLAIAGIGWWGVRKGKEVVETMADPQKRVAKVQEVLPYRELPAGYYPAFSFSAPFGFMEMAILADHEPTATTRSSPETGKGGKDIDFELDFEQRGFIYMNVRDFKNDQDRLRRFLRGEAPMPEDSPWVHSNVDFDTDELIRRGAVTAASRQVLYAAFRGEVSRHRHGSDDGIVTMLMPQCAGKRVRFGLWFGPDPDPRKSIAEVDFTGTAADPAAIQEFLGHFELCGREKSR